MPDFERPSIAFPAFQTPAGLLPQTDREQRSDYAATQNMARELSRRTDGAWVNIPYSPGRFRPIAWAVQKKLFYTGRYKVIGSELRVNFDIVGTLSVSGVAVSLILPERLRARQWTDTTIYSVSNGVGASALAYVPPGGRWIDFYQLSFVNWPVGSVQVVGQMVIEVEEF